MIDPLIDSPGLGDPPVVADPKDSAAMALPPPPVEIPLQEAVARFLASVDRRARVQSLSAATAKNYRVDLERFLELLPRASEHTAESVTGQDVDEALLLFAGTADHRRKPGLGEQSRDVRRRMAATAREAKSAGSTLRMRRSLSRFFAYCTEQSWATVSPMAASELIPQGEDPLRVERTSLDIEEAQALLRHGPGTRESNRHWDRDAIALGLMMVVGLRAGEIVRLDADHHSPAGPAGPARVTVYGKGRSTRVVPIAAWIDEQISSYRARLGPEAPAPLLLSATGRRLAVRDIERLLERAVQRTRTAEPRLARGVVPHGLRHTAATLMLADGWDVKVVARLLGHSSVSTTSRYLDELPGELSAAIDAHPLRP